MSDDPAEADSAVDPDAVERLLHPGSYWDGVQVVDNPVFSQLRVAPAPPAPTREERLLTRGIEVATRLHRQGLAVNVETLRDDAQDIPEQTWRELVAAPLFRQALEDRGIPSVRMDGLTPQQLSALEVWAELSMKGRSHPAKLRALGITETVWRAWNRIPAFAAARQLEAETALQDEIPTAIDNIVQANRSGQKWATELLLEMTGRHDRRTQGPSMQELVTLVFMVLDDAGTPEATMQLIATKLRTRMGLQPGVAAAPPQQAIASPVQARSAS
jgi:hypothetical protein